MNNSELWLEVPGYETLYKVSNKGRIKSMTYNKILKQSFLNSGYARIILCKEGKIKAFSVHRLVAIAFIPNPDNYRYVNHKDENKLNNCVENLEWCSAIQNLKHSNVIETMLNASHKANEKTVLMFHKGKFIAEYESITKAAEAINTFQQHVTNCLYGKQKTTRGYSFKFKNN